MIDQADVVRLADFSVYVDDHSAGLKFSLEATHGLTLSTLTIMIFFWIEWYQHTQVFTISEAPWVFLFLIRMMLLILSAAIHFPSHLLFGNYLKLSYPINTEGYWATLNMDFDLAVQLVVSRPSSYNPDRFHSKTMEKHPISLDVS